MTSANVNEYQPGSSDDRPWGRWTVLACGDGYVVKEIVVNAGEVLSLQSHQHRAEHWVVIAGVAEVTVGEKVFSRSKNESVHIPVGTRHRIANIGSEPLRFIELQTGALLSEDDIERFEDRYGRTV